MALPKIETPSYSMVLPSKEGEIKFRPFTVKEEKILMMALQGQDTVDVVQALRDVIESCVESNIDIKKLTMFDIEYVFLQLRARSVGDTIQLTYSSPEDLCKDNKIIIEIKDNYKIWELIKVRLK